ncbi:MAG: LamG-like jellyroll fold domain-containing protein [Gammaproteobacteria bacterium]
MSIRALSYVLVTSIALFSAPASAGNCDAYYPLDGNLNDASGNGHDGELLDKQNEPATGARYEPGVAGQALRVTGNKFVRTPLNLQTTDCPKVTVTAWLFFKDRDAGPHTLFSTGYGIGPRINRSGASLTAYGSSNNIKVSNAAQPGVWLFVAGTWDYENGVHRIYWNNRYKEEPLGTGKRPPQEYFWIGADGYLGSIHYISENVLIDDVRVYGRILAPIEIANAQRMFAPRTIAPAPIEQSAKTFTAGRSCDAHYPMDGGLNDVSGNGYNGVAIDTDGNPANGEPNFVQGKHGLAMQLDGASAMVSPLDLHFSLCPRVTITAWVYFEDEPTNSRTIMSTGYGAGPRFDAGGSTLHARGGSKSVRQKNFFAQGEWAFVVGQWDYPAGIHRIITPNGTIEAPLGDYARPPQPGFWLGAYAYNQSMLSPAHNMRIDDVRVYGQILDEQAIAAVATNAPTNKYALPGGTWGGGQPDFPTSVKDVSTIGTVGGASAIGGSAIGATGALGAGGEEPASEPRTIAEMEEALLETQAVSAGAVDPDLQKTTEGPGDVLQRDIETAQEAGFEEYQRQQNEEFENNFGPRDRAQVTVATHQGAGKVSFAARPFEILAGPANPPMSGASSASWRPVIKDLQELLRLKNTNSYLVVTKDGRIAITGQTNGRHTTIVNEINAIAANGRPIDLITEDGNGYIIISGTEVKSSNAPGGAVAWAEQQLRLRAQITALALLGDGAWIGVSTRGVTAGGMHANHYGGEVRDKAAQLFGSGERIEDIGATWSIDSGVTTGSWAIATDKQIYFQNDSDCDNHEGFGLNASIKMSRDWNCRVPVPPCPSNRPAWTFSDMASPSNDDVWDINVLVTIGVADYDGEEKERIDCWLEESYQQVEALYDRSPAMRIHVRTRRVEEYGGRRLSRVEFDSSGDYRQYMESNFDIVAPTKTSGYFQVVLVDEMCIGEEDGQPNCGVAGRATFPHDVEPFSRKYGIMMEYAPSDQGLMAHEFGHYLGLKHTFEPYGITTNTCNKDYDANWLKVKDRYCRSCLSGMDLENDRCAGQYNVMDYCSNPQPPQQVYVNDCQERRAAGTRDGYMDSDGRTKYKKMKGSR